MKIKWSLHKPSNKVILLLKNQVKFYMNEWSETEIFKESFILASKTKYLGINIRKCMLNIYTLKFKNTDKKDQRIHIL